MISTNILPYKYKSNKICAMYDFPTNIMAVALPPFCHLHCSDSLLEKNTHTHDMRKCLNPLYIENLLRLKQYGTFALL